MRLFDDSTDITDGITSSIWMALNNAISKNSTESFRVLKKFVRHVIQTSIHYNSLKHFQQYIFFPSFYYSTSYVKLKRNPSLLDTHKYCSEEAARQLKEIIWFDIIFRVRNKNNVIDEKNANLFYYWAFQGFSRLLYYTVENCDISQFRFALNEYSQISKGNDNQTYHLKREIRNLVSQNIAGHNDELLIEKKNALKVLKEFDNYKRHVLIGIKYWIFFLYKVEKMDENTVLQFIQHIEIPNTDSDDLLSDILLFRDNTSYNTYMGWNEWDYLERESGRIYSPPQPIEWMTSGFFVDQIRNESYFVNLSELDSDDIAQTSFLLEDIKNNARYFEVNFEKWKNILTVNDIEKYRQKSKKILEDYAFVNRKSVTMTDRAIALASLYQPYIEECKISLGNAWKSQARIHKLFRHIGNSVNVTGQNIQLNQIGRSIFLEKSKMMFTEEHHHTIFGLERIGGEIGRWEDDYFLDFIRNTDHHRVSGESIIESLNKCLDEQKVKEKKTNFILISTKYSYKDDKFLKSEQFQANLNKQKPKNELDQLCIGTFDGIPVYTSSSESLNSIILVCNFENAFQQLYKTHDNWFDNELLVNVRLVTDEIAQNRLKENKAKWITVENGPNLSDDEALLLIKTSVILDIWATVDYKIIDKDAYILGYIKTDNEE